MGDAKPSKSWLSKRENHIYIYCLTTTTRMNIAVTGNIIRVFFLAGDNI